MMSLFVDLKVSFARMQREFWQTCGAENVWTCCWRKSTTAQHRKTGRWRQSTVCL